MIRLRQVKIPITNNTKENHLKKIAKLLQINATNIKNY